MKATLVTGLSLLRPREESAVLSLAPRGRRTRVKSPVVAQALTGLAALLVSMLAGSAASHAQDFQVIPLLPGDLFGEAAAVSADGTVVVGRSSSPASGQTPGTTSQAIRWTAATGTVGLGFVSGFTLTSFAAGASSDGSVVVGSSGSGPQLEAFRWTARGGMAGIPLSSGDAVDLAGATSANGTTIVGMRASNATNPAHAFRWALDGGFTDLGVLAGFDLSIANAVNAAGWAIVGWNSNSTTLVTEAFLWTPASGMTGLGVLTGDTSSVAYGISADGSTIVGTSSGSGGRHAFRWTANGGLVALGVLPGDTDSTAYAASADGSVVVGTSEGPAGSHAFRWTAARGMESIEARLTASGVNLAGFRLWKAAGVSADGATIVGTGRNFSTASAQGWIAHLPAVHDFNRDGKSDIAWRDSCRTRRSRPRWRREGLQTRSSVGALRFDWVWPAFLDSWIARN